MNRRIGYARVATDDKRLDMQREALKLAGCSVIYEDEASGKSATHPELDQCWKALRTGDTLVVWRLDRLGRNLSNLVQIVADLERQGVGFESLTEKIETDGAAGKLVFPCLRGVGRVRAWLDPTAYPGWASCSSC